MSLIRMPGSLRSSLCRLPQHIVRLDFEAAYSSFSPMVLTQTPWGGLTNSAGPAIIFGRHNMIQFTAELGRHFDPRDGQFHGLEILDDDCVAMRWSLELVNWGTGRSGIMIRRDVFRICADHVVEYAPDGNLQLFSELFET